jgi:DNA-binding NtrC family response regulator
VTRMSRVAIVDDEPRMAEVLAMVLRRDGYDVTTFGAPLDFVEQLQVGQFDLLLTDLKMPGLDGVQVLKRAKATDPDLPVILLTAHATVETAVAAMKQGALDYLNKPIDNGACRAAVARALEMTRLIRENRHLRQEVGRRYGLANIVAESPAMREVLDLAMRAARSTTTALISGESGTGKEVVARAIHVHSERVGGPFVAVNCKAFAAGVLESELFGHEKGAFTGAAGARAGVFERADGGTLLLDEIGEISADFQAKLLRVLQEREVQRVGGDQPRAVDVRILSATNRDLRAEVAAGRFREDLYFRLAVVPIALPPLRDRPEDILPLARSFLERLAREQRRNVIGWTDEVQAWLVAHAWPGNVRELENTLERGVVLARGERIELSDVSLGTTTAPMLDDGASLTLQEHLDRAAADRIRRALEEAGGVRVDAARALGVERTTLYRLMKRFGVE